MSPPAAAHRARWRALGLLAVLLLVLYVTGGLVAYNAGGTFSDLGLPPDLLLAVALVPLLVPALAARDRSFSSPALKVIWSFLAACGFHLLGLLVLLWLKEQDSSWLGLPSVATEMGYGHWRTFFTIAWLASFALIHAPGRRATLGLSVVPLFVWGIESTSIHFMWSHPSLELYWLLAMASALALVVALAALGLWRWLSGAPPLRQGARFAGLVTILTVLFDWGFTLFVITQLESRDAAARETPAPVVECEPATLALPEQEVRSGAMRASFRPLLVGCASTVRCLSDQQRSAIAARLEEVVALDPEDEFEQRHAPHRWRQLAALVEDELGCAVAEEIILTDFTLERAFAARAETVGDEPLLVGGDVLAPKRLAGNASALEPLLPDYADAVVCIFRTVVSREGRIADAELLKPEECAPEPERVMLEMFASWRFEPATLHGRPVAVRYYLTLHHCPCLDLRQTGSRF